METTPLHAPAGKTYAALNDETLIALALEGNQRAYAILARRHESLLRPVIGRYLKDVNEIDEAIQDTYVRAFQALPNFRGESKFSSWLYRIAVSVAINQLRSRQRHARRVDSSAELEKLDIGLPPEGARKVEKDEARHWLRHAICQLSSSDAQVLRLFYFEEQSIQEICQLSGWTESNVKSKLSRARQRLRGILETQFPAHLLN
jgi:RNA polymerase sigma-70 factor (ECF subfamily)